MVLLAVPVAGLAMFATAFVRYGPAGAAVLVVAAASTGAVIEAAGATGPHAGLSGHVAALAALGCIAGSWLGGVGFGMVRRTSAMSATAGRPVGRAA
jgi:hypothetical protein